MTIPRNRTEKRTTALNIVSGSSARRTRSIADGQARAELFGEHILRAPDHDGVAGMDPENARLRDEPAVRHWLTGVHTPPHKAPVIVIGGDLYVRPGQPFPLH